MTKLRTSSITWLCSAPASAQCFWSCVTLTRAGASASNEPSQVAARLWDNLTHLHRDTCCSSSSQAVNTKVKQDENFPENSQHTTAHTVFIQWIHLIIIIIFFTSYSCSLTHDQWLQQPPPSGLRVCQEPQAAYYSITLLYIGCWQLNTWIHERREHSKWTSKSKKPKNYKKKRKTEKPEILENYMIECAWCKFCITNSFTSHKYRLILRPVDVTVLKSTRIKSVRGRSSKKERSLRFLLKTSTTTKHEKIKWKYSKFKMKLSKLHKQHQAEKILHITYSHSHLNIVFALSYMYI